MSVIEMSVIGRPAMSESQAAAQARRVIVPGDVVQELGGPEATQSVVDKLMTTEVQAQRADEPLVNIYGGGVTTPIDTFRLPSEPTLPERWRDHCADQERAIAVLHEAIDMQSKTIAELRAQMSDPPRADEPSLDERMRDRYRGYTDEELQRACTRLMQRAQMSDPPQSEQLATDTSAGAVQRRINDVCQDLVAGRTTPDQRRGLGGAVERAGRIPAGSDAAVGRIARLPR